MKIKRPPVPAMRSPRYRISSAGTDDLTAAPIEPSARFIVVAVATVTVLAVLDAMTGPRLVLAGLMAVGPCLVVASGRPPAVLAVGGYACGLMSALAWWPDQIWGTLHHLLYLLSTAGVTAVSVMLARRVRLLKQRAELAGESRRILAALVECSDDVIVGMTLDGIVTAWNPAAERTSGYSAAEAVGAHISIVAGPGGSAEFSGLLAKVAGGQRIDHFDAQRTHKDGTLVDVSVAVSPIRDDQGVVVGASTVARDISTRCQAEARQRVTDEYLRTLGAIVESSEDAIIAKALDGTVTVWNPGAERLYGYTAAEAIGNDMLMIAGTGKDIEVSNLLARVLAGRHAEPYEADRTHKDGSLVNVSVSLSPIHDAHGVVVGVAGVARDVTARKRAEARQREIDERTQLAQRLQSLGQLAGGIAHDFNNLLAIIGNYTIFAIEQTTHDQAVQADLAQVKTAAERAGGLTRQLLMFTRGESDRPELVDVNAAIAEAHALLARTIGEDIDLIAVPSPEPLTISADSGQIQQILINLAVNARDAMPDGGTLVIEAALADLDEYQTDLQPGLHPGRFARLLVSDTGIGMSKDVLAHIFEPFFTTKPVGVGTGLGLATVYGIVTDAGGTLNVYSELNVGTTFRAYFPVAQDTTGAPAAEPDIAEPPRGAGQTIIVVDDEPAIRQVADRILTKAGYRVRSAEGGAAALELDAQSPCQLLLTDVVMPTMSGRRLVELIRRRHPALPVLYMSGYSDGLRATPEVIADQDIGFIEKPFTAHDLLVQIHGLLDHSHAGALAVAH